MGERFEIRMAVYVRFEKDGKVLLSLRKNTGYHDGDYGVVQGHVEPDEEIKAAAIREAKEEAMVDVAPEDMQLVAICHDQRGINYMHFIYKCEQWSGELVNGEPECCAGLEWFDKNNLPENMIPKVKEFVGWEGESSLIERS